MEHRRPHDRGALQPLRNPVVNWAGAYRRRLLWKFLSHSYQQRNIQWQTAIRFALITLHHLCGPKLTCRTVIPGIVGSPNQIWLEPIAENLGYDATRHILHEVESLLTKSRTVRRHSIIIDIVYRLCITRVHIPKRSYRQLVLQLVPTSTNAHCWALEILEMISTCLIFSSRELGNFSRGRCYG